MGDISYEPTDMGIPRIPLPFSDERWAEAPSFDVPVAEYPIPSGATFPTEISELRTISENILKELNDILANKNYPGFHKLMNTGSSFWRDHLCINNTKYSTLYGPKEVISLILNGGCDLQSLQIDESKEPQAKSIDLAGQVKCIQSFLTLKTSIGVGRGLMKLIRDVNDGDKWKVYLMYTGLRDLDCYPESGVTGINRPSHAVPADVPSSVSWREFIEKKRLFVDEEPAVLVVGAGHCGMMIAARLGILGVKTLVIDTQERTGDSWRTRYRHLCLHDGCWMNSMPYLPYPSNWPVYCAKDKMADFLESYASIMELSIWNRTVVANSTWDNKAKRWSVTLESQRDGKTVKTTINPRHVVQSTGLNGAPRIPQFAGMNEFDGKIIHSSEFSGASRDSYAGKKVIVVGSGNSAHDIAYDTCKNGAQVTMIQRGTTFVKTAYSNLKDLYSLYNEHTPLEDSDMLLISSPISLAKRTGYDFGAVSAQQDKLILDGLTEAGFSVPKGPDYPNVLVLGAQRGGGFYIDIGCSSLIADGSIKVKQGQEISRITKRSMIFADGTEIEADEIILATGYTGVRQRTAKIFGEDVARNIEPVWGFDEMGEQRGVWKRSGQEGFYVAAGNYWLARYFSRLLALQIKAIEVGISRP